MNTTKTVVLFKTHKWRSDIEKFAAKIYHETVIHGIDFYILMHCENSASCNNIKNESIKKNILRFSEKEIRSIYSAGFYSMWLSNHWILMWFYKKYGHKYKYFWSIDYDVRISGNSSRIWLYEGAYDFLYTMGNYHNPKNKYINYYVGDKLDTADKYFGYLQLARYSDKLLEYLNKCFSQGENGQDELIIFSLLKRSGLSSSNTFLQSLIRGNWTWQSSYSEYNRKIYHDYEARHHQYLYIFHPVK